MALAEVQGNEGPPLTDNVKDNAPVVSSDLSPFVLTLMEQPFCLDPNGVALSS